MRRRRGAGTVGRQKPVKQLDIAVSGTDGANGDGARLVEGRPTGDKRSSARAGGDMDAGSDKESVSVLQGFTIGVRDGSSARAPTSWTGAG